MKKVLDVFDVSEIKNKAMFSRAHMRNTIV